MAKRKPKELPVRSSAQIKEYNSRSIFEQAIQPWMICSWMDEDFGVDASVEIMRPIPSSKDEIATGKRFSVQLKSTDSKDFDRDKISLNVPIEKVSYWYNSVEPVLIALIDLKSKDVYYIWIDSELIDHLYSLNPNWIANHTVTIHFDKNKKVESKGLLTLEEHVINWKRPQKTILAPGTFFRYSSDAAAYIENISELTSKNGIEMFRSEIEEMRKQLSKAIYTIAIAGPSRSGKSTLINALLTREISPVGVFPTTGVPITIVPKEENRSIIVFKNGKNVLGSIDSSFIEQYTSQERNPNNIKQVKLVSVHVKNNLLEKGFALCDIPGLDDPSEEIRAISKIALYSVNAIIYVINASPMRDGGFSFTRQIVDDMKELGGKVDKLFLIFNKVDQLTQLQITQLSTYVDSSLKSYGISKYLPSKPFYLSTKIAFDDRKSGKGNSELDHVEQEIWKFLLSNNKTGLNKLLGSFGDIRQLLEKLQNTIGTRLLDLTKRRELEDEITQVEGGLKQLHDWVKVRAEKILEQDRRILANSMANVLDHLRADLESRPVHESLPATPLITSWLENHLLSIMSQLQDKLETQIRTLQTQINTWIATRLKQVEISIEVEREDDSFQIPNIQEYINQINPGFQEEESTHPGVLETILITIGNIIVGLVEQLTKAFTSKSAIRNKQIEKLCNKAQVSFVSIAERFNSHLSNFVTITTNSMVIKSHDRTMVYLGNLRGQLKNLEKSISDEERIKYNHFMSELSEIISRVSSDFMNLENYTNGLKAS